MEERCTQAMCQENTEENKWRNKGTKNKVMNAVSKAMREKAEEVLTELQNCPNGMFGLVKVSKTGRKEDEGGRCMRGNDGKLCSGEKERCKVWKDYMK